MKLVERFLSKNGFKAPRRALATNRDAPDLRAERKVGPDKVLGATQDATPRKMAEKALKEADGKYRAIFDNAIQGIFQTTPDGKFLAANPALAQILGYASPEQLIQERTDIAHQGYVDPQRREEFKRCLDENDGVIGFEHEVYRKDGSKIWISENARIVHNAAGEVLCFEGTFEDITERKRAETARREADQNLADIINSVEGIVWEADQATGQFTFVSEKAEEILGYPTARWLSEPGFWQNHLHPDDREKTIVFFTAATAQWRPPEIEYRMISAEGGEVWFKDRIAVVGLPGQSIKQRGIMLDVTERKRAEVAARAGEAQIREQARLLDLAHDAIMVRCMEDRILYWNHGAEELYGWNVAEVQGKQASTFLHEETPAVLAARMAVAESGKWSGECKHLRKGGGIVMVRSRWTLVRDDLGAPTSILIINTDITEQKRVEKQFLRAQRLESIGTLASGVAHDLNNILVPILMAAPLLRGDLPKAEREKFLAIVESSAERGASIVKQVLTFARGADGDRVLLQPIYLIEEIAKIAERTFPKSITVRTRYPENLRTLEADATQLHQVLLNLAINARDAMPQGGDLTLSVENFDVDDHYASMTPGAKPGPHVMMQVSDTGTGIPRHVIDKIFDPFFTTKSVGLGTGLGLSTVLGIVKSHGGFMHVCSEAGHTSFKVFFPAVQGDDFAPGTPSPVDIPTGQGQTILIVDDEIGIREVAQAVLIQHGYKAIVAEDGPAALALLARHSSEIQLMLTDMVMPFMDGVTLVRTVRKMEPDIKVLLSTGRDEDCSTAEVAALHVNGCLPKPYTRETLLLMLDQVLNTSAPLPA